MIIKEDNRRRFAEISIIGSYLGKDLQAYLLSILQLFFMRGWILEEFRGIEFSRMWSSQAIVCCQHRLHDI